MLNLTHERIIWIRYAPRSTRLSFLIISHLIVNHHLYLINTLMLITDLTALQHWYVNFSHHTHTVVSLGQGGILPVRAANWGKWALMTSSTLVVACFILSRSSGGRSLYGGGLLGVVVALWARLAEGPLVVPTHVSGRPPPRASYVILIIDFGKVLAALLSSL